MNNFIFQLTDYIDKLKTGYPVQIGKLADTESLAIIPVASNNIVREYMDGTKEIRLSYAIKLKTKSQNKAITILSEIVESITNTSNFTETTKANYSLLNVIIEQMPHFAEEQEIGYYTYNAQIAVDITK